MVENNEQTPLLHNQRRERFARTLKRLVPCGISIYIALQMFRLASLVMFSIFAVDCVLWHDSTSVDCKNFTVYSSTICSPYCWETIWLSSSILTSTICACALCRTFLPELRPVGNKAIWKCLLRKPFFWSLNGVLAIALLYDALIMVQNEDARTPSECLVAASKVWTLYFIYQLNFTFPPSRQKNFRPITRAAYCITLLIFALDNLCKFLVVSAQVAFKFYTVRKNSARPIAIVDLMLMIINASLYHTFF